MSSQAIFIFGDFAELLLLKDLEKHLFLLKDLDKQLFLFKQCPDCSLETETKNANKHNEICQLQLKERTEKLKEAYQCHESIIERITKNTDETITVFYNKIAKALANAITDIETINSNEGEICSKPLIDISTAVFIRGLPKYIASEVFPKAKNLQDAYERTLQIIDTNNHRTTTNKSFIETKFQQSSINTKEKPITIMDTTDTINTLTTMDTQDTKDTPNTKPFIDTKDTTLKIANQTLLIETNFEMDTTTTPTPLNDATSLALPPTSTNSKIDENKIDSTVDVLLDDIIICWEANKLSRSQNQTGVQTQQVNSLPNQPTKNQQELKKLQQLNQAAIRDLHHSKSNLKIERTTD